MSDDLPPREEDANPEAPRQSGRRTAMIWLILVAVFVTVYTTATDDDLGDVLWVIAQIAWPIVVLGGALYWLLRQVRGGTRLNATMEPGLLELADDRPARAGDTFRALLPAHADRPLVAAPIRYNLAIALLRQGKLAEATDELLAVERVKNVVYGAPLRTMASAYLAWIFALRGDVASSEAWLTDARRRLRKADDRISPATMQALAAFTLAARRGQLDEAARLFDEHAVRMEVNLVGHVMRAAWLIRAFVATRRDDPRDAGHADTWLRMARGARGADLEYLGAEWPELTAFLASHR